MQRWCHRVLVLLVVFGVAGCSNDSVPNSKANSNASIGPPKPLPPPPPPPTPSPADVSSNASKEQPAATPQPPAQPVAPPEPSPPPAVAQLPIHLATGVALAQTGPEGTMMMFSVDYEVAQGEPSTSAYVWVIERAHGASGKVQVKLTTRGTLTAAMTVKWQPEDGPFHSHLEDGKGNRISESIEMLQPGT